MGQHLGWSLYLGIHSHPAGIYSHTTLIICNLLVIDAVRYLNIRVPLLGMKHDRLTSRGSRLEPRYPLGEILAYS